ncbi:hypothetical protein FQZ97_1067640 [compost metagenome]
MPAPSRSSSIAAQSPGFTTTVSTTSPTAQRLYFALLIDSIRLAPAVGVKAVKLPASVRPDRFGLVPLPISSCLSMRCARPSRRRVSMYAATAGASASSWLDTLIQ